MSDANKPIELVFVIDESGSMMHLQNDTIGGINSVLAEHKKTEGNVIVTIVTFSDTHRTIIDHMPIAQVKDLTTDDYLPRGTTALLDALGDTVSATIANNKKLPKTERHDVIVCVITDGEENASREWTNDKVKKLVKKCQKKGWEFIFLGANIDAFSAAASIGISRNRASSYVSDSKGTSAAFEAMAMATSSYRTTGAVLDSWSDEVASDARNRA